MDRKQAYYEKLKDPRWQQKRLRIFERDQWTCQVCGSTERTLHVHHIAYSPYGGEPWDGSERLLVTICEHCHELEGGQHREMLYTLLDMLAGAGIRTACDLFSVIALAGPVIADNEKERGDDPVFAATALGMSIQEWPQRKERLLADGTYYADRK